MSNFLPKGHPDEYKDIPVKEGPPEFYPWMTEVCPECEGHGYRNLEVDAYGPGKHFQQMCYCMGWGYRKPGACPHKNQKHVAVIGRCFNRYKCLDCGATIEIDSSD